MAGTALVLDSGWGRVDDDDKAEVQQDKRYQIKTESKSEVPAGDQRVTMSGKLLDRV